MKSVEYSQLVKRKLLKLKKELAGEYGEEKTKEILTAMADHVDMLGQHEESGCCLQPPRKQLRAGDGRKRCQAGLLPPHPQPRQILGADPFPGHLHQITGECVNV